MLGPDEDPDDFRSAHFPSNADDMHKNAPAPRGPWEFPPGTNLNQAEINKPDPSKLVIHRQKVSNPSVTDMRVYPHRHAFDWSSQDSIDRLNKSREQIKNRTQGVGQMGKPWTQLERDTLELVIKETFEHGVANGAELDVRICFPLVA